VPFEDGESGCIDITLTAKSPIFVRVGLNEEKFCNHNGEFYIPGSSVKGMVRNILEIMSFSKMSFINDTTYSIRDLKYNKYMEKSKNAQCGWLYYDKEDDNKLKIEDCGVPNRIHHNQIDLAFNIEFAKDFQQKGFENTAKYKYKKLEKRDLTLNISESYTSKNNSKYDERIFCKYEENSSIKGTLVLTGQIQARGNTGKPRDGKGFEFVFLDKKDELLVSEKVFDNFKFAYFDKREKQPKESEDWAFWKKKLENGEKIPVFFHKDITGQVGSFGLSYLYKFPYTNSIMKALISSHTSDSIDLSESIMGYSKKIDENQVSLKGRVQFSHAKTINTINELSSRHILLGGPKASYYPIYIVQNGGEYKTLMDNNAVLAGWKRYPIHKNFKHHGDTQSKQTSKITPLDENTKFKFKIRVHNLKKVELGALLSALTFHNNEDNFFHSIGMGKAYGYGKVSLKINQIDGFKHKKVEYIKSFEACMNSEINENNISWHKSEQIKNLLAMASEQDDSNLVYMELKEFAKEKNDNNYLHRYIDLSGVNEKNINALCNEKDIQDYNNSMEELREKERIIQKEKDEIKAKQEEEQKIIQKEKDDWLKVKASNTIQAYKDFKDNNKNSPHFNEATIKIEELKSDEQEKKEKAIQNEIKRAFNNLKKDNSRHVETFMKKWQDNEYAKEYIQELKNLNTSNKENKIDINDLKTVNDSKRFKSILESNKDDLTSHKELIKEEAIRVYKLQKGKKQKKFFQEIQLQRFLGVDFENEVKNTI